MESLFNASGAEHFISRINKLTPQSQPQWGKMDVAQMLTHCQKFIQVALGELKADVNPLLALLFGRAAKKSLLNGKPFKKNLPTLKEAVITDPRKFDEEKNALIAVIRKFHSDRGSRVPARHPFFGKLAPHEWDLLQAKHLDHHLQQFGA
jgi:hypothetical protein